MTGADAAVEQRDIGKNKILIQCLDTSGSMSGSPIEALKEGAILIGRRYYEAEQRPFEEFITMEYNSNCTDFAAANFDDYERRIRQLRAGGGTNFMNVFFKIKELLDARPNLEELVVIFITDGCDGYYPNFGTREEAYDEKSRDI